MREKSSRRFASAGVAYCQTIICSTLWSVWHHVNDDAMIEIEYLRPGVSSEGGCVQRESIRAG